MPESLGEVKDKSPQLGVWNVVLYDFSFNALPWWDARPKRDMKKGLTVLSPF